MMSGYTSSMTSLRRIRSGDVSFYIKALSLMVLDICVKHGLKIAIVYENFISFVEGEDMKRKGRFKTFLLHRFIPSFIVSIMAIVLVGIGFNIVYKPATYANTFKYDNLGYPWNDATLIDSSNYDWGYPANSCPVNDPKCTSYITGAHTVLNGKQYGVSDPWGYE